MSRLMSMAQKYFRMYKKKITKEEVEEKNKSLKNTLPPRNDASLGYDPEPAARPTDEGFGW